MKYNEFYLIKRTYSNSVLIGRSGGVIEIFRGIHGHYRFNSFYSFATLNQCVELIIEEIFGFDINDVEIRNL